MESEKLLKIPEVENKIGHCAEWIRLEEKNNRGVTRRVKCGTRSVRFRESEIDAWIASRRPPVTN